MTRVHTAAEPAHPHSRPILSRSVTWERRGLLALVAIMPFHAFLSVWAGHLFGHQAIWQSWKEVLLIVLAALAGLIAVREPGRLRRLRNPAVYAAAGFVAVGLVVSLAAHAELKGAVFGLKTDAEFLLAMVLAWLVADRPFAGMVRRIIIVTCGAVIAFGVLQIYVLPADWLVHFGYGPQTIQPYLRVDPAIQAVRIVSTLGGPNQLGSFLLVPLCLVGWGLLRRPRVWQAIYLAAGIVVLWHTYARSAWLGAAVAAFVLIIARLPRRWRLRVVLLAMVVAAIGIQLLAAAATRNGHLQYYVLHETSHSTGVAASTDEHSAASRAGLRIAEHHLGGEGFGTAGPASFHSNHPFIPENNYLQLAIETGVAGLLLFMVVQVSTGWQLARRTVPHQLGVPLVSALIGIGTVNFFLQGWADSSTALVFWTAAGAALGAAV